MVTQAQERSPPAQLVNSPVPTIIVTTPDGEVVQPCEDVVPMRSSATKAPKLALLHPLWLSRHLIHGVLRAAALERATAAAKRPTPARSLAAIVETEFPASDAPSLSRSANTSVASSSLDALDYAIDALGTSLGPSYSDADPIFGLDEAGLPEWLRDDEGGNEKQDVKSKVADVTESSPRVVKLPTASFSRRRNPLVVPLAARSSVFVGASTVSVHGEVSRPSHRSSSCARDLLAGLA
jgi:hypothetical protein